MNAGEGEFMVINVDTGEYIDKVFFEVDPTPQKKIRLNPLGEDVYLFPDGSVKRDEDYIIAAQRIWIERAYMPGTGVMYLKGLERFNAAVNSGQGQSETHTRPLEPYVS